jgi:hypothetical protein
MRIGERQLEALPETGMAHAMEAFELERLADRSIAVPARDAHGSTRSPKLEHDQQEPPHGMTPLRVAKRETDRSVGFPGCAGRAEGVANSAKNVDRFAEELGL